MLYGGIEAGGTKFVCGVGSGPGDLICREIRATSPEQTLPLAIAFFKQHAAVRAVGIGSFGPVDLAAGRITTTPKPGWRDCDIVHRIRQALGVPVVFDTDVNAAALGERTWGAARDIDPFLYITVGTGIGGGGFVNGQPLHGLSHPEMGHLRVPHDLTADPFPGVCPWHGDCLEGLACGPAIEARWKTSPAALGLDHPAWNMEADYLAAGVANWICTLSPKLILISGGVMRRETLLPLVRARVGELINGYAPVPEIRSPALGKNAGILGCIRLAEQL